MLSMFGTRKKSHEPYNETTLPGTNTNEDPRRDPTSIYDVEEVIASTGRPQAPSQPPPHTLVNDVGEVVASYMPHADRMDIIHSLEAAEKEGKLTKTAANAFFFGVLQAEHRTLKAQYQFEVKQESQRQKRLLSYKMQYLYWATCFGLQRAFCSFPWCSTVFTLCSVCLLIEALTNLVSCDFSPGNTCFDCAKAIGCCPCERSVEHLVVEFYDARKDKGETLSPKHNRGLYFTICCVYPKAPMERTRNKIGRLHSQKEYVGSKAKHDNLLALFKRYNVCEDPNVCEEPGLQVMQ